MEAIHRRTLRRLAPQLGGRRGALILAVGRSPRVRAEVTQEIRRLCPNRPVREIVSEASGIDPWAAIREASAEDAIVILCGLGPSEQRRREVLRALNLGRALATRERFRLVLWLDDEAQLTQITEQAPDLWAFRSAVILMNGLSDFAWQNQTAPVRISLVQALRDLDRRLRSSLLNSEQRALTLIRRYQLLRKSSNASIKAESLHELQAHLKTLPALTEESNERLAAASFSYQASLLGDQGKLEEIQRFADTVMGRGDLTQRVAVVVRLNIDTVRQRWPESQSRLHSIEEMEATQEYLGQLVVGGLARPFIDQADMLIQRGLLSRADDAIEKANRHLEKDHSDDSTSSVSRDFLRSNVRRLTSRIQLAKGHTQSALRLILPWLADPVEMQSWQSKSKDIAQSVHLLKSLGLMQSAVDVANSMLNHDSIRSEAVLWSEVAASTLDALSIVDPGRALSQMRETRRQVQRSIDGAEMPSRGSLRVWMARLLNGELKDRDPNKDERLRSEGLRLLLKTADEARAQSLPQLESEALNELGNIYLKRSSPREALSIFTRRQALLTDFRWGCAPRAEARIDEARSSLASGTPSDALALLTEADELILQDGEEGYSRTARRRCLEERATTMLVMGDRDGARQALETAHAMLNEQGLRPAAWEVELKRLPLLPIEQAHPRTVEAIGAAVEMGLPGLERDAYVALAEASLAQGQHDAARGALAEAQELASIMGDGQVGERLAALAKQLN